MNGSIELLWLIWVGLALLLALVELLTLSFFCLMLAGGALAAAVAAFSGASLVVQVVVFVAVATLLLGIVRPIAVRRFAATRREERTGAEALIGRDALVLEAVTDRSGLVKLAGERWTARSTERAFEVGETVEVVRIDGATAVVGESRGVDRRPPSAAPEPKEAR